MYLAVGKRSVYQQYFSIWTTGINIVTVCSLGWIMNLKLFNIALLLVSFTVLMAACEQSSPASSSSSSSSATKSQSSASQSTSSVSWSSSNAVNYIGERGTVCGPVVDTRYATGSNGKPTFLNFDRSYPNHTMVVVIWGSDRSSFPNNPENYYKGKNVCATGLIESYKGKPEIIARDSNQLELQR